MLQVKSPNDLGPSVVFLIISIAQSPISVAIGNKVLESINIIDC